MTFSINHVLPPNPAVASDSSPSVSPLLISAPIQPFVRLLTRKIIPPLMFTRACRCPWSCERIPQRSQTAGGQRESDSIIIWREFFVVLAGLFILAEAISATAGPHFDTHGLSVCPFGSFVLIWSDTSSGPSASELVLRPTHHREVLQHKIFAFCF